MKWAEVRYVVEGAAEDEIVSAAVDGRSSEQKDGGGDENWKVIKMASNAVFTQY